MIAPKLERQRSLSRLSFVFTNLLDHPGVSTQNFLDFNGITFSRTPSKAPGVPLKATVLVLKPCLPAASSMRPSKTRTLKSAGSWETMVSLDDNLQFEESR